MESTALISRHVATLNAKVFTKNQTKDIAGSDKIGIKYKFARAQCVTYRVHVNRCSEIPPEQKYKIFCIYVWVKYIYILQVLRY